MIQWQDWEVTEGVISRNQAGQFEARLTLRHENHLAFPGEYSLACVFDETGAKWGWQPVEPDFISDREENINSERVSIWGWQPTEPDFISDREENSD